MRRNTLRYYVLRGLIRSIRGVAKLLDVLSEALRRISMEAGGMISQHSDDSLDRLLHTSLAVDLHDGYQQRARPPSAINGTASSSTGTAQGVLIQ